MLAFWFYFEFQIWLFDAIWGFWDLFIEIDSKEFDEKEAAKIPPVILCEITSSREITGSLNRAVEYRSYGNSIFENLFSTTSFTRAWNAP